MKISCHNTVHEHMSKDERCPECNNFLIITDAGSSYCSNEKFCNYTDKGAENEKIRKT